MCDLISHDGEYKFHFMFIHLLFNDAESSSDYIKSNGRMINER
jgi:hypothetical protein